MLGSGTDILDAVEFFNKHGISTAPVQNPLGEILGQLTEINLVKALVYYRAGGNYTKVIHAEEHFEPVFFVNDEDEIAAVLKTIVRAPTHRVLVRDRKEKVIGIISPKDLLRSIQGGGDVSRVVVDEVQALQRELSDLRGKLHEMSQYLQTYDIVFQSGMFGLHSVDRLGKVVFANEKLHEGLGYPPGELIGKTIFDIYPKEHHDEAREGLRRVMTEGRHSMTHSAMVRKDGTMTNVDIASAALKDEKGRFIGTFTISRFHGSDAMNIETGHLFK
jgi:PAS domain S-box-containing protein